MIDSHCHLDHEPLSTNLKEVISRSKAIGINKLLTICTTINSYENILKIVEIDPIIYGTFGIHPHETDNDKVSKNEIVKKIKLNKKIIGVGETGLDFHYNNSDKESQLMSFKKHIEASIELNIPLIIHSRNAESETYNVLHEFIKDNLKILMHCFTGSSDFSKKMLSLGAYISLSGIITFNKSKELQKTASSIPIDRLLIETDSPYLAPIPKRGSANEPSFIKYIAMKLAEIKQISYDDLLVHTSNNFNKLFSLNQ
jgi:TatD DNase family protein